MTCVPRAISTLSSAPVRSRLLALVPLAAFALVILFTRLLDNVLLLAAGTLVSEDLTCLAVAHAIRAGTMHWLPALTGCVAGIFVGDIALYAIGRTFSRPLIAHPRLARWRSSLQRAPARQIRAAIVASRALPGTRLPLYLAAGALHVPFRLFALWTFVAVVLWTPLLIASAAFLGEVLARRHPAYAATGIVLLTTYALLQLLRKLPAVRRWEFWPAWLFYLPLVPYLLIQSLRHRSLTLVTLANPGIPLGGLVGESKSDILASLRSRHVMPHVLLNALTPDDNLAHLSAFSYPLILKPDVGQRGAGVRLVYSADQALSYLHSTRVSLIAQQYHPGPHEAGIFYYRLPHEPAGHIFSITHKVFPTVTGDGRSTLRNLILAHPRYRLQADRFFARHADKIDTILPPGQTLQLALAGNHCQGTLFTDGAHLITPALEHAIDCIARSHPGFHFGRFDVRYTNPAAFMAGQDLAVVELNGLTAESSNLYDPRHSLLGAYRILFRQWQVAFQIAAANRRLGHRPPPLRTVISSLLAYRRSPKPNSLAD